MVTLLDRPTAFTRLVKARKNHPGIACKFGSFMNFNRRKMTFDCCSLGLIVLDEIGLRRFSIEILSLRECQQSEKIKQLAMTILGVGEYHLGEFIYGYDTQEREEECLKDNLFESHSKNLPFGRGPLEKWDLKDAWFDEGVWCGRYIQAVMRGDLE